MSRTEEVRKLRESGMSIDEICERLGAYEREQRHEVVRICRKAGMPITEEEKHISISRGQLHDNDWADEYIKQKTEGKYIRISDYINMDSEITIRCVQCGTEQTIRFSRFRSDKRICCPLCYEAEREQKRKQKTESERRDRLMKAERMRIKKLKGKQITLRFCIDCNEALTTEKEKCKRCQKALISRNKEVKRRVKIRSAMVDRDITLDKVFKKDEGRCHICGKECNINDYIVKNGVFIAGNYYPSIDHVIPLAKGGQHSWDNVKIAHRICNSLKKDSL